MGLLVISLLALIWVFIITILLGTGLRCIYFRRVYLGAFFIALLFLVLMVSFFTLGFSFWDVWIGMKIVTA